MAPRGRPATDEFWLEEVRKLHGAQKDVKAAEVLAYLTRVGRVTGRSDVPKIHTVRRLLSKATGDAPEMQSGYQEVYWPETFEQGLLPWEAAPAFLELLSFYNGKPVGFIATLIWSTFFPDRQPRPDLRTTLWFYRVTLAAAPDTPVHIRLMNASQLAQGPAVNRDIEYSLAGVAFERVKDGDPFEGMSQEEIEDHAIEAGAKLIEGMAPSVEEALSGAIERGEAFMWLKTYMEAKAENRNVDEEINSYPGNTSDERADAWMKDQMDRARTPSVNGTSQEDTDGPPS